MRNRTGQLIRKDDYWDMPLFDIFGNLGKNLFNSFDTEFNSTFGYYESVSKKDGKLYVDVPGFNKDNLKVEFEKGFVYLTGKTETGRKIEKYVSVKKEPIDAKIADGVLELTFEEDKPPTKKKIEIT